MVAHNRGRAYTAPIGLKHRSGRGPAMSREREHPAARRRRLYQATHAELLAEVLAAPDRGAGSGAYWPRLSRDQLISKLLGGTS